MHIARRAAAVRGVAIAAAAVLAVAGPLFAHGLLRRAEPAVGSRLTTAPRELRLIFSEAVEVAVARLELRGPHGPVALAAVRRGDSSSVIVAGIVGALTAGEYTVAWQVVGRDGHPVRDRFRFTIAPGAAGLADSAAGGALAAQRADSAPSADTALHVHESAVSDSASPRAERPLATDSPAFAAVRWVTVASMLALVGSAGFLLVVVPGAERRGAGDGWGARAQVGGRLVGIFGAATLLVASGFRLVAQMASFGGARAAGDTDAMRAMVGSTMWGRAFLIQLVAAGLAIVALTLLPRLRGVGRGMLVASIIAVALSASLSGHPAAVPRFTAVAIASDTAHVLAAGGWLGTLLVLTLVGLRANRNAADGTHGRSVAAAVSAFSPLALACAGVVALTGAVSATLELQALRALWTTEYGKALLWKVGFVVLVVVAGAWNWRRLRPTLGDDASARRMRRSATIELALAALVLAVTAVLMATPTPAELVR